MLWMNADATPIYMRGREPAKRIDSMTDHETIREWLRSLDKGERKVVKSEVAKWNNKSRRIHSGGRPKVLKPCPKCGVSFGARELAKHIPACS